MKRPKMLYRYNTGSHLWSVHAVKSDEVIEWIACNQYGTLWRNRWSATGDHYGYATRKEARLEAIQNIRDEISSLTRILNAFTKQKD